MISNDLYGNGTLSAYESAKGYTRPVDPKVSPINVPQEIKTAQEEIISKRKFNLILRSKALHMPPLDVGDVAEVYIKNDKQKRGKRCAPKTVLSFHPRSGIFEVPGKQGKTLKVALEDVRYALSSPFAMDVARAMGDLDEEIESALPENVQQNPQTSSADLSDDEDRRVFYR